MLRTLVWPMLMMFDPAWAVDGDAIQAQFDRNMAKESYEMYIKVQNELTAAFGELRDEISQRFYGVKFANLINEDYRKAIQKAVPMAISEAEPENIGGN